MKCPLCGQYHADDIKFCPIEGRLIPSQIVQQISCPKCGAAVQSEWGACPRCGHKLSILSGNDTAPAVVEVPINSIPEAQSEPDKLAVKDEGEQGSSSPEENQGNRPISSGGETPVLGQGSNGNQLKINPVGVAFCPKCGNSIQSHWKTCSRCGVQLKPDRSRLAVIFPWLLGIGIIALIAVIGIILISIPAINPSPTSKPTVELTQSGGVVPTGKPETPTPTQTAIVTVSITPTVMPSALPSVAPVVLPSVKMTEEKVSSIREAGSYNAIAIDGNGLLSVVFLKENDDRGVNDKDQLVFSQRVGNTWSYQALTSGSKNEGYVNSLIADAQGNLHLSSYSYEEQRIYYGIKRGAGVWDLRPVYYAPRGKDAKGLANIVPPISLALDADGNPRMVFMDLVNNRLIYLSPRSQASSDWLARVVVSGLDTKGYLFPMVVGSGNQPVIAFYNSSSTAKQPAGLQVAKLIGTEWQIETLDADPSTGRTVGLYPSLARDSKGQLYLAYFDTYQVALKLLVFDGKTWQTPVVVDPRGGQYTSIAVDNNGRIHLAYYEQGTQTLRYVVGTTEGFGQPTVLKMNIPLMDANFKETKSISITLDGNGQPWISFFDPTDMLLKIFQLTVP